MVDCFLVPHSRRLEALLRSPDESLPVRVGIGFHIFSDQDKTSQYCAAVKPSRTVLMLVWFEVDSTW